MNITELDSYNLADAVKFNDQLNPAIWSGDKMKPEVRERLMVIAQDFKEFLGLSDIEVKDITVSGSNAGYTYTPYSDIDLHLVVDIPQADESDVYRELFDAKKYQYNDQHNITIGGYDVELYVEDARKQPVSQGIYSVMNNDWVKIPRKIRATVNDEAVKSKFEDLGHRIESAIASQDGVAIAELAKKIKNMRQAGLDAHGELGAENLAYKMLRNQGLIKKLYDARTAAQDAEMSLNERRKKKSKKKKVKYGFGGYWYPGYNFDTGSDAGSADAGGGDGGGESIEEKVNAPTDEQILRDFVDFCVKELKIQKLPTIKLRRDPQWPEVHKTFGRYIDDRDMLEVAWGNRHIMDVLRTVAHELTHRRQHEREAVPADAGETGSRYENEANARAGILMRDYARLHPEYFAHGQADDLTGIEEGWKEKAAGLAAAACIAGTPGCATTTGQVAKDVQTVGRTAQTVKGMTKQGVQAELDQELRNFIRAQGQGPGSANAKNQSRLYQLQKKMEKPEPQNESASGYIPTKKQSKDPRFSMALTQDIKPGQVGKEANKLKLDTDSQGHPDLLIKGLRNALREFKETGRIDSLGNQTPPGPEFKPTMPKGTVRVDVSDVYDWYKLGQHIANMKGLGQHDFGQGPPSTIVSFGDEDTEHKFIGDLEATGLDVTDIDPADPVQRPGRKIKTDPTYNVNEELLDLTRMYQGYDSVVGQVIDTSTKKTKIRIVAADGRGKLKVGDVIAINPHYLKNVPVRESVELDEVKMSPSALAKFASSPEAEGIRAGFEAELIFRDTAGDAEEQDMEPDYDMDERARTVDEVIDFFMNDEYGYGLSDRQADRLRNQLDEAYFEWRDDQIIDAFNRESEDLVREVWLEERPMDERILSALTDGMGLDDAEADQVMAAGNKAPRFTKNADQEEYKKENERYAQYLEAVDIADEILDEEVEASIDNQDGYYDQALDNFRDGYDADDSDFFNDIGLRWMSDVANEYSLDWPYYTGGGNSNYGSRDWDDIGVSLRNATGMPVKVSSGYHSQKRGDYYVIEPDGSLDPDDKNEEVGLEIVSPPMPLNQAIEQLQKVVEWANDPNEGNAYTNRSTGLHMGVSIPYKGGDVDYLKLILFMGDKYVLDKFGRAANTYTASAMEKLKQNVAGSKNRNDDKIASAMELMKNNLLELAQNYVQQGVGNSKYTSAHIKDGYIEFRSPGGDYLAKADEEINVLEDTMRRFAYAMYLAGRPDLERPEYYKKLYKLIAPEGNKDLELFSKFSAGEITAEQLKKQWAEKVISKEVPADNKKSNWRLYNRRTGEPVPGQDYSNYTELDAIERAKAKVSPASSMTDFNQTYELRDVGTNTGRWRVIRRDNHETLEIIDAATRGEASDQAYEKYTDVIPYYIEPYGGEQPSEPEPKLSRRAKLAKQIAQPRDYVIINKHSLLPFYTFRASTMSQAVDFSVTYLRDKGLDVENFSVQRASNAQQAIDNARDSRQIQQRLDPQVRDIDITVDQDSGQYEIVDRRTNRVMLQYSADSATDAGDKFNNWLRNQGMPIDTENYGYRAMASAATNQPQQARSANGVPLWDLYDQETGTVLRNIADHNEREAMQQALSWLRTVGAEDPDTYRERFAVRPKMSTATNESIDDAQKARNAMDAAAKKLGYANWAAVPQSAKNTVMQMAVNALKLDNGHYNMLDRKNKVKETKVTPVAPVRQDAMRTKYNQVPRKDDPAVNPAVIVKISPEAKKQKK